jgi:hypothetical protein
MLGGLKAVRHRRFCFLLSPFSSSFQVLYRGTPTQPREATATSEYLPYQLRDHMRRLISKIGMMGRRALRDRAGDDDVAGSSAVGLPTDHHNPATVDAQHHSLPQLSRHEDSFPTSLLPDSQSYSPAFTSPPTAFPTMSQHDQSPDASGSLPLAPFRQFQSRPSIALTQSGNTLSEFVIPDM